MAKKRGRAGLSESRKSQLTAFMLIGIVIVAIFGFMYFTSGEIKKSDIESNIDIAEERIRETGILNRYVTLCLKDSLQEGLIIIGKQGGYIMGQPEHVEYGGYKVAYGINSSVFGPDILAPPAYPCINDPATTSYYCGSAFPNRILAPKKLYPFGAKSLPYLCDPNGPNAAYLHVFPFPCPTGTYGPGSIQVQLSTFIEAKLPRCVNITPIEQVTGLEIASGRPNVTIAFGEDDIFATATYPLNISLGRQGSVRFFDFEVNLPVRFKKIFGMADFLANREVYDIEFNVNDDYPEYRYFGKEVLPPMHAEIHDLGPGKNVIEINDTVSIIEGKPYIFRFAVKNRIPALDPVSDTSATEGGTVIVPVQAYEADDNDILTYTAEGIRPGCWSYSAGQLSCDTSLGDSGTYTVTVRACDSSGQCDSQDITATIHSAGS